MITVCTTDVARLRQAELLREADGRRAATIARRARRARRDTEWTGHAEPQLRRLGLSAQSEPGAELAT